VFDISFSGGTFIVVGDYRGGVPCPAKNIRNQLAGISGILIERREETNEF
jgi:hypothetical protein